MQVSGCFCNLAGPYLMSPRDREIESNGRLDMVRANRTCQTLRPARRLRDIPILAKIACYLVLAEIVLPFIAVAAFAFDREISNIYELDHDPTTLTSLFFLQYRYNFFLTKIGSANLHLYDFHIFEVVAWLAVLIAVLRFVTVFFLVDFFDARVDVRAIFPVSGIKYFFGWLFIVPGGIIASMDVSLGTSVIGRYFMTYSPRAFLCMQALMFCLSCFVFCEGFWAMVQLVVAVKRRGTLAKIDDS